MCAHVCVCRIGHGADATVAVHVFEGHVKWMLGIGGVGSTVPSSQPLDGRWWGGLYVQLLLLLQS